MTIADKLGDNVPDEIQSMRTGRPDTKRHEGVTCGFCGERIERESNGASSPIGSLHKGCALEHERQYPSQW